VAFKKLRGGKNKAQLISLMDMAFLLLLFFLVTTLVSQSTKSEQQLTIPTPENKQPGRAQIMIQLINQNSYLFVDQTTNDVVQDVINQWGFLPHNLLMQRIAETLLAQCRYNDAQLQEKLSQLRSRANQHPEEEYFILIRCPDELPYYLVIDLIRAISGLPNLNYGCVGGSIYQIQTAKEIALVVETVKGARRENLVITF